MRQEGDQERGDDPLVPLGADRALSPRHVGKALRGLELARSLDALRVAAGQYTTVRLRDDRSMGFLNIRDRRGDPYNEGWEYLGEARGTITVPAFKELGLWVSLDASRDLSPLATLEPSALFFLGLQGTQVAHAGVAHIRSLTSCSASARASRTT